MFQRRCDWRFQHGCGSAEAGVDGVVLYSAVIVFISGIAAVVLTASNSAAEITPLSRKTAASRSLCSVVDALAVIDRASADVSIPFASRTRTSGSVAVSACAKLINEPIWITITIKPNRTHELMIGSFL